MWLKIKKTFLNSPPLNLSIYNEIDKNFNSLIEKLIKELNTKENRLKLDGRKIDIIIPQNFGKTVYEYATNEEKEYYTKNGYSDALGNFSIYKENNLIYYKLIINHIVFKDLSYLSTITHEFTHSIDFSEYIKKYGNPNDMNKFQKNKNFYFEFYLWTEFNAKKNGLLRYQKELDKDNLKLSICIEDFKNEINIQNNRISKLYTLVHFLARCYVCNKVGYPFNIDIDLNLFLKSKFGLNIFLIQETIEKINSFKDFEKDKTELRYFLNSNQFIF